MNVQLGRCVAATLQIGCGLLAVLLCASAVMYLVDASDSARRGLWVGIILGLGAGLFVIWWLARRRRRWLVTLLLVCVFLAIVLIAITVEIGRTAMSSPREGLWAGFWSAALDAGLWIVIAAAAGVELRFVDHPSEQEHRPWQVFAAVAAPLALIIAATIVVGTALPTWMVRANSRVSEVAAASGTGQGSSLSGGQRWSLELDARAEALPVRDGLAVAVPGRLRHSAGVIMIDPTSGRVSWRYELRGVDNAPHLQSTDDGRAVVVTFDESDLPDGVPHRTFTLSAATGEVVAFWPTSGEVKATEPPVLFDHVPQGTNSVIAISPTGRRLWTYQPEPCADPRDVSSTSVVMLVRAFTCDDPATDVQLLGLDALTGEQRWVQPGSQLSQVLVEPEFQLEIGDTTMQRRQLDTGAVSWSRPLPRCSRPRPATAADETVYVAGCVGESIGAGTVEALFVGSGTPRWRHTTEQPAGSVVAVDDSRVLALVPGPRTCNLIVLDDAGSKTLLSVPAYDRSEDPEPGLVRCPESSVWRIGDSYVLQLFLVTRNPSSPRYRFIGLA